MTLNPPKPRSEYLRRFNKVLDQLDALDAELRQIKDAIDRTKAQGMTDATIHWRQEGMLELVYSINSDYARRNGRRREYIGVDQDKIDEAMARIARHTRYQELLSDARHIYNQIRNIESAITNVFRVTAKGPLELPLDGDTQNGDKEISPANLVCPHNEQKNLSPLAMSPRQVKEFFEQSPELADIAKDLPKEWA